MPQNGCKRPAGTCLANQLTDLATADKARAAAGSTPLYFIGRYGGGTANAKQVPCASASGHVLRFGECAIVNHDKGFLIASTPAAADATCRDALLWCFRTPSLASTAQPVLPTRCHVSALLHLPNLLGSKPDIHRPRLLLQAFSSGSQLYLGLPVPGGTSSLVVLSVSADDLELVTNRCPGNITAAQVRVP